MKTSINDLDHVLNILEENYKRSKAPSVTLISETKKTPFSVLVSTIISARTKDEITLNASQKLFEKANSFEEIMKLEIKDIEKIIYPAGFYKTKAKRLKEIASLVVNKMQGKIPDTIESLLELPGVGRKTANLVVSLGFNKPGLCVDTHVHRITNRFGWVSTKSPTETEYALRDFLPKKFWRAINDYLVSYGQTICRPISPLCSICKLDKLCPKINVDKNR